MNEEEIKAFLGDNPFHGQLGKIDVPLNYGTGEGAPAAPNYPTDNPYWGQLGGWDEVHATPGANELQRLGVPYQAGEDNTPLLGAYQSGGEIFGRALAGFGKQAVAGFTDAVASWDLQGMYNMAAGNSEEEFGNWLNQSALSKWGKDMTGNEIYQYGDSMMSANYWGKMTQTLGYTGGIIAEILAEQAILNAITPGAGAAGLASKGRLIGQGAFGMWKGVQEGYMNGLETMDQVYQEYKAKGYSEEDAKRIAAEAATFAYRTEVGPLMIINGLQFASVFGKGGAFKGTPELGTGFSSLGESVLSRIPTGSNKFIKGGANVVTNALSEGLEEGIQTTIQRYSQYKTDKENFETIQDFKLWSPETTDSVIAGMFGGAIFSGSGNLMNKVFQERGLVDKAQVQEDFIKDSMSRTASSFAEQQRISQNYTQAQKDFLTNRTPENATKLQKAKEEVENARYNSHLTNAINALHYDYLNGDTKGYDSHIEQMQNILDAVNSKDINTLKKFGLVDEQGKEKYQGSFQTIQDTFEQNIQDSATIKNLLENNLNNVTSDFDSAFNIVKKEFSNIKNVQRLGNYDTDLQLLYNKDTQYSMLSPEGKERFRLENEITALEQVEKDETTKELSKADKERLVELNTQLQELEDYSTKDKSIVPSISRQPYINAEVSKVSINQSIEQNISDLKDLKNIKKINESIKDRQKKAIENAKTQKAVQKELAKASSAGVADREIEQAAERKAEQLDINERIQEVAPEVQLDEQPIPNSQENTLDDDTFNKLMEDHNNGNFQPLESGPETQFSRRTQGNFTQQAIDLANSLISDLERSLNRPADFKDFVASRIEKSGYEYAEKMFDSFKSVWEQSGRPINNVGEIYDNFFNRDELFNQLLEEKLTEDEVTNYHNTVDSITQDANISTAKQDMFDVHGKPMDIIETESTIENDRRTTSATPKLSHYHQEYERGPNGEFIVTSDSLVTNPFIGNNYILDPDFISQGDNLEVQVFDNNEVPITELIDNKPIKTTWGAYKAKHNITTSDARYINKVPMIAYKNGIPVSFIQDATWYIPENINSNLSEQERIDVAQKGFDNTVALRNEILSGNNILTVSHRGFGQVDKINEHRNTEPISVANATGNSELAFVLEDNGVKTLYTQKGKPFEGKIIGDLDKRKSNGTAMFNVGGIVDLRWVYNENGQPVYIALPVMQKNPVAENDNLKSDLPVEIFNSIKFATLAASILNNIDNSELIDRIGTQYGITISKAKDIKNAISSSVGINIESNLTGYVGLFVQVGSSKYKNAYLTQQQNSDNIPVGQTFFDSFGTGELKIYNKNNQNKTDKARPSSFGSKVTDVNIYMNNLVSAFNDINGSVMKGSFNVNFDRLNSKVYADKGFVTIDNSGTPQNNYENYNEFVKNNIYTNIKSHEITSEDGSKKWVTDIQPVLNISISNDIVAPNTSQEVIEQVHQDLIETAQTQNYTDAEQDFYDSLPDELKALYSTLGTPVDGLDNPDILSSRRVDTQEERDRFAKFNTNKISTLSTREQSELVSSLKNLIITDIDFKSGVTESDIKKLISQSVSKHVTPILNNYKAIYDNMSKIPALANSPNIRELQVRINKLQGIVNESLKLTSLDVNNKGSLAKEFDRLLNLDLQESEDLDIQDLENITQDEEENESNVLENADDSFTKSFMEKDLKLSYSNKLKLSLFGIPKLQGENKNRATSVLTGLPQFESADDVELRLKDITTEIISDWDTFINKLDYMYESGKGNIYSQLKAKFANEEIFTEQLRNELLYKMISSRLNIYKVLNRTITDKQGNVTGYELQIIDENNLKEDLRLKTQIRDYFTYNSVLSKSNEKNERVLNLEVAKKYQTALRNNIAQANKNNTIDEDKVRDIFSHFGLDFSDNTLKEYFKTTNPYSQKNGILFYIEKGLSSLIDKTNNGATEVVLTEADNNLFDNASGALNRLIEIEISLNGTNIAKSIRVGGKVMQGTIQNTSAYDTVKKLTSNRDNIIEQLQQIGYTQNNILLELLMNDPNFKDILSIDFSSPEAYKVHGRDLFSDADFDKISPQDNLAATLGLFMNTKGYSNLSNPGDIRAGIKFRIGQLPFNTLSDKGRMIYLKTALVDAKSNISIAEDGSIEIDDNLLSYMSEQLFQSEFNRIVDSYRYGTHGIQGFDNTSKIFTLIPKLNTITVGGINIHDLLKAGAYDMNKYLPEAKRIISEVINEQVDAKLSIDGQSGELRLFGMHEGDNISTDFINKSTGNTQTEKIRSAMADYSINYILNQANVYQLFLGDAAYYSKDKLIPTYSENGQTYVDSKALLNNNRYVDIAKAISVIVDKRAASLIAPGSKLANSEDKSGKYNTQYLQVQVNDVESMSEVMRELIISQYGELTTEQTRALDRIDELNKEIEKALEQNNEEALYGENGLLEEKQENIAILENSTTGLDGYFNMTGTDAQEYTTWKSHIDVLMRKGDLTSEQYALLKSAYDKMSAGKFNEVTSEEISVVMQPVKPVYTGQIPLVAETTDTNGQKISKIIGMRPIYIKSSSFPLLPQLTNNLKIDAVRQKLEALEEKTGKTVRMSYQTANKIGASKTALTMNDLYNKSMDELYDSSDIQPKGLLADSLLTLNYSDFKIQQETPVKTKKFLAKNSDNYITMGSQFWKIKLANGVNKMTDKIFPDLYSRELLRELGITPENGMLSGEDLDKIDFEIYRRFSETQKDMLYSELGLEEGTPFNSLSTNEKTKVMDNLVAIIRDEIIKRGYPDYLQNVLGIDVNEHNVSTEIPLMLDANANKFEALLQALISNRLISHKLPGNGHISTSSEGFEKVTNLEELDADTRQGIVWIDPERTGRLQATKNSNGRIMESEVLVQSHYRVTTQNEDGTKSTKLIDMMSDEYSEPIVVDGKVTGRALRLDKIDKSLLSNFSFRIPTSSHQSGVILKIAGFLPPQSGDMLVVPAEHTVQLGEDYDIDKRYVYKSNYYLNKDGIIKEVQYKDYSVEELADEFLTALQDEDLNGIVDSETYKRNKMKIKAFENIMINIYKSVYQSPSNVVQQKIFKPLVTDIAETTAFAMDKLLSSNTSENFTMLGDSYQRYLLNLGADGKGGIGKHSNAVTFEAQLQRLPKDRKVQLMRDEIVQLPNGETELVSVNADESIGSLKSTGILGAQYKTLDGYRDIAEQHGENQNVSTDNINKQIMGKRNENSYTMGVYALMAMRGFDLSLDKVVAPQFKKPTQLHIPSLFVNQPIIRDFVELMQKYSSITAEFLPNKELFVVQQLLTKYGYPLEVRNTTDFLPERMYAEMSAKMDGQRLWDNLEKGPNMENELQLAVLQKFMRFKAEESQLAKAQRLINLSTSKLGVSYFETLQRISMLDDLGLNRVSGAQNLIGESRLNPATMEIDWTEERRLEEIRLLKENGYKLVGKYFWKPTTTEGVMLLNSLSSAQDLMSIFFPYDHPVIKETINYIFNQKDKDVNDTSGSSLKWKYEIMSSMRDFMYSGTNTSLFRGDVNEERRRLFFNTESNASLAKVLQTLRKEKNPIMENLFLKDLQLQVRDVVPSLITATSNFNTNFDKTTKYEAFLELVNDHTNLGMYNGETMTPHKLAQDLATYAMLSDNQNGATGFRQYIHIDYLKAIGFTEDLRNIIYDINNGKDLTGQLEKFKEQYFQHHPERTFILSNNTVNENLIQLGDPRAQRALINALKQGTNINNIINTQDSFRFETGKRDYNPDYISVRNTNIVNSENKYSLFKFNPNTGLYHRIETLGTVGYNEYNANVFSQPSLIPNNVDKSPKFKGNNYYDTGLKRQAAYVPVSTIFPEGKGISHILETYMNSQNTPQEDKEFIENLIKYGNPNAKLVYQKPANGALGSYNATTNEIYINPNIYEIILEDSNFDMVEARKVLREVLVEEIIHSMTVREFNKYVQTYDKATGEITLTDNAPVFATKLVALYQSAKDIVPYNPTDNSTYYSKDIYEFMAGMFVAPDYRAQLEEKSPNIVKKFLKIIRDMLGTLYTAVTGENFSYNNETFNAVYDLLKTSNSVTTAPQTQSGNIIEEMKKDDIDLSEQNESPRNEGFRYPEIKKC